MIEETAAGQDWNTIPPELRLEIYKKLWVPRTVTIYRCAHHHVTTDFEREVLTLARSQNRDKFDQDIAIDARSVATHCPAIEVPREDPVPDPNHDPETAGDGFLCGPHGQWDASWLRLLRESMPLDDAGTSDSHPHDPSRQHPPPPPLYGTTTFARVDTGTRIPITLWIDRESRAETLKHYRLAFALRGGASRVYFNFGVDTLRVPVHGKLWRLVQRRDLQDLVRLRMVGTADDPSASRSRGLDATAATTHNPAEPPAAMGALLRALCPRLRHVTIEPAWACARNDLTWRRHEAEENVVIFNRQELRELEVSCPGCTWNHGHRPCGVLLRRLRELRWLVDIPLILPGSNGPSEPGLLLTFHSSRPIDDFVNGGDHGYGVPGYVRSEERYLGLDEAEVASTLFLHGQHPRASVAEDFHRLYTINAMQHNINLACDLTTHPAARKHRTGVMGGGTSIWASPDWKKDPKEIFNYKLWFLVTTVAFAGFSYGFDHGNVGGVLTLPSFRHTFGLDRMSPAASAAREGDIASMMSAGAAVGALSAGPFSDKLGRKWSVFMYGFLFLVGAVMQLIANLDVFQGGRFIGGFAIGGTSVLSPMYLAECAPKTIRGSLTTLYNLAIITALALAFWVNYGVSRWSYPGLATDEKQWRTAMSIQIIPGGLLVVMAAFLIDSPRGLISLGKREKGLENLCKLRNLPADHNYVRQEYLEICAQADVGQELNKNRTYLLAARDIIKVPSYRRRFTLACLLFIFHKLTGTDAINYFAPQIFAMLGVQKGSMSLMTTGVYGVVKLAASLIYVTVIVDRVGRRLPLMIGATIQATAMLYIALYTKFGNPDPSAGPGPGGIVGIIMIYLYAFGWSFGHSVAPYVVAAEIFPSGIRAFCMSFCLMLNWLFGFGVAKATPVMMESIGWATFLVFAVITYAGVVFVYFCLPELKGRSIESMDDLFEHRLWEMFRWAYPTEEEKIRKDVQQAMLDESKGVVEHSERTVGEESDSTGNRQAAPKV
ncbi:hypothetical protein PpBr36_05004 [Pyricularia pennisetigena]|uniref:hypothetical protein n=1 Tax=Pyricularia pennisetigena TaxID=1578925 RepID=UPI0011506D28|nr:hypothetical protein PpBr36_05004 [Pyricularia pennisetigena]TLS26143.1 hypothetical protein PpBr36_05004 [Pyricularia pennisetigena]